MLWSSQLVNHLFTGGMASHRKKTTASQVVTGEDSENVDPIPNVTSNTASQKIKQ